MSIKLVGQDVELPPWLDCKFLQQILAEDVIEAKVERAVPKGNNYLSALYRVSVTLRTKERGLIVKSLPKGDIMQQMVREMRCFSKECQMYGVTLPKLHTLLAPHKLGAYCYPTTLEEVIVLEDLTRIGYRMGDRRKGLNLQQCQSVMQGLARLHASSLALIRADPNAVDKYGESLFDEAGKERMASMVEAQLTDLATMAESWPGYERFGDKIRVLIPTAMDRVMEMVKPQEGKLSVLNHGDCWVNNIMFHSTEVLDCRFVDFQMTRFTSPAIDLQYFLNLSPDVDVRTHHVPQLLQEYHSKFLTALDQLQIQDVQYPLEQFLRDFEDKNFFGLFTALFVLWVTIADEENIPDLSTLKEEDLTGKTEIWKSMSHGKRYMELLKLLLPKFEKDGVL